MNTRPSITSPDGYRKIRSFVRREGRITPSQQRALHELWPRYGVDVEDSVLDLVSLFGRRAPVILEIGFGNGRSLAEIASTNQQQDYIGIDVHRPGVGSLLLQLQESGTNNVRVICNDAVQVLQKNIADKSLDAVLLFFPDPWPKKRHHKRRIVQPDFIELVRTRLKVNGQLHMATDWQDYAEHMLAVMSANPGFVNMAPDKSYAERPDCRPMTKFEQRGRKLGHGVWDLIFVRQQ